MKKVRKIMALSLCFIFLLTACGKQTTPTDQSSGNEGSENSGESNSETQGSESSGSSNKDVIVGVNANFITLDPHAARDTLSNSAIDLMVEGLMNYDENAELYANLADTYSISDDALTYTFKLHEGVKFHDGTDFNADAVKINFDRVMDESLALRQRNNLKMLKEWNVLDEYTIEFKLSEPYMVFLDKLASVRILSPKAIEDFGEENIPKNPIGTGQYKLVKWDEGESCVMERFADHRNADDVKIDTLTFKFIPENSTRVAMLETGEADFIYPMPSEMVDKLKGNSEIVIETKPSTICRYVSMNQLKGPLSNVLVRKAMNHAIDKDAYIKVVKGGYADYLTSSMSHVLPFQTEHDIYEYDVEKAKSLLKEAGYPDGFTITLWGSNDTETVKGMNFLNQQLSAVGITVDVVPMEEGTLSDKVYKTTPETAEIEMWYVSWSALDVDNATKSLFNSAYFPPTGANTGYYSNPDLDRLMDEANSLTDREGQMAKYKEIQDMIWDDAVWIFLGVDQIVYAKRSNIDGMIVGPSGKLDFRFAEKK